ncbi:MAG: hypothetical protein ISS23_01265 [Nanoarchaeota archaeon]|nr:hypothetical protein [Nanoarchaeota archaeon]
MRTVILLAFFILIPLALAAKTETTELLHINDSSTVEGKTLTILSADRSGKLKVSVDGVEGIVRPGINRTSNINEMFIEILNFTYLDPETIDAILEITVNFECGDGYCNFSESSVICCTDCGCEGNVKCINNICQKEDCVIDADCEDNDPCTIDKCSADPPRTCSNTLITKCVNNDTCCPNICGFENDTDCIETEKKIEEEPVEKKEKEEPKLEKSEEVFEEPEEDRLSEKEKGILIIIGVALSVIIIGFFIFLRK